jgi:hypothetical protein
MLSSQQGGEMKPPDSSGERLGLLLVAVALLPRMGAQMPFCRLFGPSSCVGRQYRLVEQVSLTKVQASLRKLLTVARPNHFEE